jgi:hypothetical protein
MYMRWGLALSESHCFFLEQLVSEAASRFAFFAFLRWYWAMHFPRIFSLHTEITTPFRP